MGDNYYYDLNDYSLCPSWAPVLGFGGIVAAVVFASKFGSVELFGAFGDPGLLSPLSPLNGVDNS